MSKYHLFLFALFEEICIQANYLIFYDITRHRDRVYLAEKHVRQMVDQVGRDVSKVTDSIMTSLHLELQRWAPALGSFLSWCISFYGSDVSFPIPIAGFFNASGKASLVYAHLPQLDYLETF